MSDIQQSDDPKGIWCLIANVKKAYPSGPGGHEIRNGTLHFYGGAKVYCLPSRWGDGYEKIPVIGPHRHTHQYIAMVIPSRVLTNWRIKVVYHPKMLELAQGNLWWSKTEVEHMLAALLDREAQ